MRRFLERPGVHLNHNRWSGCTLVEELGGLSGPDVAPVQEAVDHGLVTVLEHLLHLEVGGDARGFSASSEAGLVFSVNDQTKKVV